MTAPLFDLSGRVAVVTGAGGLLGQEHCLALAALGARVASTDIAHDAAQRTADRVSAEWPDARCVAYAMDVTDEASIVGVRAALLDRWGRVDILVNNAAIDPKMTAGGAGTEFSRLEHFPLDQWQRQLDVGLTGALLCARAFGGWMATHDGGVILNVASDLSVIAPDQRLYRRAGAAPDEQPVKPITYSVIKTGLIGLTRYLATYWADRHVRVNALSPGGVYAGQPLAFVDRLQQLIPLGRMAARDEYHGVVQFLCSDASSYMTGQNIVMDGGRSIW